MDGAILFKRHSHHPIDLLKTLRNYRPHSELCGMAKHTLVKRVKQSSLQAWSNPEDSRKLRFPDFMTTAQDGGKVISLTQRPPLPPGNTRGTHFC
jgi:hypothetical protein